MSYRATNESSTQTPQERCEEARRILNKVGLADHVDEMTSAEQNFVSRLISDLEIADVPVSIKQLFWLRDLVDKYC
jgi:hypothetical protein